MSYKQFLASVHFIFGLNYDFKFLEIILQQLWSFFKMCPMVPEPCKVYAWEEQSCAAASQACLFLVARDKSKPVRKLCWLSIYLVSYFFFLSLSKLILCFGFVSGFLVANKLFLVGDSNNLKNFFFGLTISISL